MKVVITGGGGFLGHQLCRKLQSLGKLTGPSGNPEAIEQVGLFDAHFADEVRDQLSTTPFELTFLQADIADRDAVFQAMADADSIFHLASMVSGECEQRFDDALRVNLDGGRNVFEAARASCATSRPRLVFASSIASFGGEGMSGTMNDLTKRNPQTTYGMTKVIGELMVSDYSRKGFFDGRSARLPTVIIRPGKPNAAASSWASGMFREPLNGEICELPVRRDQCHPMTGYRTVIDSLVTLHEVPEKSLGDDRAYGLPAHRVTPKLAEQVLTEIGTERGISIGAIADAFDPSIQAIVDNWPTSVDGTRALALGLPEPPALKQIVAEYLQDFGAGG